MYRWIRRWEQMSLLQRFCVIGLFVITPFGLEMIWRGDGLWGYLTLIASLSIVVSLVIARPGFRELVARLLTVIVPGGVILAFMTHEPRYAVHWSYALVVLMYFQLPPRLALMLNGLFLASAILLLRQTYQTDELLRFIAAHLAVGTLSVAFAWDRRENERALRELALIDALTGLPNRRNLLQQLGDWTSRQQRHPVTGSLLFIDLDSFKVINDRHGHAVGDEVLQKLAMVLRERVRASDIVGRLGGEEFLVMVHDTTPQQAIVLAEELSSRCRREVFAHGSGLSLSIGIAPFESGLSVEAWIRRADEAMYRAKSTGGDRWQLAALASSPV